MSNDFKAETGHNQQAFEAFKQQVVEFCDKYPAVEELQKFKTIIMELSSFDDLDK